MKAVDSTRVFFLSRALALGALSLLFLPAACTSMAVDDLAPSAPASAAVAARPTQPDGFPNLNVGVDPAAPQISEEEREKLIGDLNALRARQARRGGAASASEAERLRRLASSHAEGTLERIESAPQ